MGRRRRLTPITLTTLAITTETQKTIKKLKSRRETQDHFIIRILAEWQDLKEYRLDMDQVLRLKDRQITSLEAELRNMKTTVNLSI